MNRAEFMAALEAQLRDITTEERDEALKFYNEYLDEAGPENEAAMNPLLYGKLRDSEKKAALAEERKREQAFRARQEARQRLVESARKRRE